jgi:hypothetical protein
MNNNFRNMNASCCKDSLVKIWKAESGKLITNMNFQSRKAKNKILKWDCFKVVEGALENIRKI